MSKLGALAGNILHHYETSLFGWLTPFLAPLLFPDKSGLDALLLTFAFIPLKYLTKPLGAIFWGCFGDKWGRKPALTTSLIGMSISTFAIGCLPLVSYAWIFLAICQTFQGFFSAGEEKGAAIYLLEQTAKEKRSWMSSLYDASGILGIFLASLLASQLGETHWRLLFWMGSFGGILGVILRQKAQESPEFIPTKFSWKIIWEERLLISRIAIVSGFSYANYYLVTVFLNGYLPRISSLTKADVLMFNTHLLWIDALLLLGFGTLCKWVRREKLMMFATFMTAILAIPLFATLDNASWSHAALIRLIFVTLGVALAAPYHAWKLELLPTHNRFLIGTLGSTLGSKFFGAPIPILATYLVSQTGYTWAPAIPLVILSLAATAVLAFVPKKAQDLKPLF